MGRCLDYVPVSVTSSSLPLIIVGDFFPIYLIGTMHVFLICFSGAEHLEELVSVILQRIGNANGGERPLIMVCWCKFNFLFFFTHGVIRWLLC